MFGQCLIVNHVLVYFKINVQGKVVTRADVEILAIVKIILHSPDCNGVNTTTEAVLLYLTFSTSCVVYLRNSCLIVIRKIEIAMIYSGCSFFQTEAFLLDLVGTLRFIYK